MLCVTQLLLACSCMACSCMEHIHGHYLGLWWRKMSLSWSGCTRDNWADLHHCKWRCRSIRTLKELFQQLFPPQSSGPVPKHEAKPKASTWALVTIKLHKFVPSADVYAKREWNGPFLLLPLTWYQSGSSLKLLPELCKSSNSDSAVFLHL